MLLIMYAVVIMGVLWFIFGKLFGFVRGTHLTIFIPTAMVGIGGATLLGAFWSTAFMNDSAYIEYWHSFNPPEYLVSRLVENAETFAPVLLVPYVFVLDLIRLWWYTVSTHLTVSIAVLNIVMFFILYVWWYVLESFCGLFTLNDRYPESIKRI